MDNSISDLFSTNEILFDSFAADDSDFIHLQSVFEQVLCTVSLIDVEETVFCTEIPKLKQCCDDVVCKITQILHNNPQDALDEINSLLGVFNDLIKFATAAVKHVNQQVNFNQVQSLPLPICHILFNSFKHCKESDHLYGIKFQEVSCALTVLFKTTNTLQTNFLNLINNHIIFDLTDAEQNNHLIQILIILSDIGETLTNLDIKTTAELWKGYLLLTQTHIQHIKHHNPEKPIKYFCRQVQESLNKNETNFKITCFNLKIIIKLCGLYDYHGDCFRELFQLLITLNKYFIPWLHFQGIDPKLIDLMQVHVSVAAEPLLGCFILNREFIQFFLKNIESELHENRLAAALLIISTLKKIDDELWIQDLISVVFKMVELLHVEFSIDLQISLPGKTGEKHQICSLYEYLLIHTVSVILISNDYKTIQKLLFNSVVQTNIWKALFASDVWCILSRYGPEISCFQQLSFLASFFLTLNQNRRPEFFYLKNLINRMFNLLTDKSKNEIMKTYPEYKWIKHDNNQICNNIESFLNCINPINFNNMVKSLELIPTNNNKIVAEKISKIWMIIPKNLQHLWQFNFVRCLTNATKSTIKHMNNKDLLTILNKIAALISNLRIHQINCSILTSLATVKISPNPDQSLVFNAISRNFKLSLSHKNPVIKQRALECFTFFAQQTIHESVLSYVVDGDTQIQEEISNYLQKIKPAACVTSIEYFQKQYGVKFQHNCVGLIQPPHKKHKSNDVNVEVVLKRMKHDTELLKECFRDGNVPQFCVDGLMGIVAELREFLPK